MREGLPFTNHALERIKKRRVTPEEVKLVIRYGAESHGEDSRYSFYRIGDRLAKKLSAKGLSVENVKNLMIVVANEDGSIVTVYPRSDSGLFPRPKHKKRWHQKRDHEARVKSGVRSKLKKASKDTVRRITDLLNRQV